MTTSLKKQTFKTLILLAALLVISIACSTENQTKEESETPAATSKDLQIISLDGSSTVFPVTEAVAEEYYIKTK